jgi:hypothetical protein
MYYCFQTQASVSQDLRKQLAEQHEEENRLRKQLAEQHEEENRLKFELAACVAAADSADKRSTRHRVMEVSTTSIRRLCCSTLQW